MMRADYLVSLHCQLESESPAQVLSLLARNPLPFATALDSTCMSHPACEQEGELGCKRKVSVQP